MNSSPTPTHTCFSKQVNLRILEQSLIFLLLSDPPSDVWAIPVGSTFKIYPEADLHRSRHQVTSISSLDYCKSPRTSFCPSPLSLFSKAARGIPLKPWSAPDPSSSSHVTQPSGQGHITIWTASPTPSRLREPTGMFRALQV